MSADAPLHAVTGAFGYSGKRIASRLLAQGARVITLTASPQRPNPFGDAIRILPFCFDQPAELRRMLKGIGVLYNTYWTRFNGPGLTYAQALRNTRVLFEAAAAAGVRRIVHISVANPDPHSPFEYFRCKAEAERILVASGLSHAILRPTIVFGGEDILINNIAWALRRLPVMGIFGNGRYRIQPVYVEDLADLAVAQGAGGSNEVVDAAGPETYAYRDFVQLIARAIGRRPLFLPVPAALAPLAARLIGVALRDVLLTRDELGALMSNRLCVSSPPSCRTRLSDWIRENAATLGRRYASELARRRDRTRPYA
jgi:NADH dehydrogenase